MAYLAILLISIAFISGTVADNPFEEFQKSALQNNPVHEAGKRVGHGMDSLQPYYICESESSGNAMTLSAWHYSCKQSCLDDNARTAVNITRVRWHYIGDDIPVYKVVTNEVCYTAHENMWGYCTQTQTIKPVATTKADKDALSNLLFHDTAQITGTRTITNSQYGDCEYFSDNTKCGRDYTVTYRPGKTSKKSDSDPLMLNVYGDGIRVDPNTGELYQNDVAWFWDKSKIQPSSDCGWWIYDDDTCRITTTSDTMYCPSIGYQYNIHNLKASSTCKGEVYDINGPAPFMYKAKTQDPKRKDIMAKAAEGKGDPDINMITGINAAFERLEETYCSSTCDLFARGLGSDDNQVLDTPLGNWRLVNSTSDHPALLPCSPTSTWKIKNPTSMCHGKDHILVEDSKTKHTCSWDTKKDYITVDDTCINTSAEAAEMDETMRRTMLRGEDVRIRFWTGDTYILSPPYTTPRWEKTNLTRTQNPSWFSKVELNQNMLHNPEDISHLLTTMAHDTKQEIMYNQTASRSVKKYILDEVLLGAGTVGAAIVSFVGSLVGTLPKLIFGVVVLVLAIWVGKTIIGWRINRRGPFDSPQRTVKFDPNISESLLGSPPQAPSAPKRRPQSRSAKLGDLFDEYGI
ncbi:glycoprotein [Datura yellow vein nucleorhabdovirus]|uniref:Glycoprotein n=1 Tax=Datura yellow vein nucleorhabdovirus TaxID=195059 RepID=A0A0F7LG26_9RHAB|nr:glycoprotein [Datura yellow vein nucleorhabdovirus]AKH61405.1 glycoprotein [Datura yellow vein nucleorhabdovirus]